MQDHDLSYPQFAISVNFRPKNPYINVYQNQLANSCSISIPHLPITCQKETNTKMQNHRAKSPASSLSQGQLEGEDIGYIHHSVNPTPKSHSNPTNITSIPLNNNVSLNFWSFKSHQYHYHAI